jgi:molybdopterin synthase sulfur carrier subunit
MTTAGTRSITILYFAAVRERLSKEREDIELPLEIADIRGLSGWLETRHPGLRGALGACRYAVGEEFREPHHELRAGDIVAIIPPVSGG